jgi:F-type H+-transporting ATPase subunit epsilon
MADRTLQIEIVTPYGMFYEGPTEMAVVTCKDGEIGILPGHSPLIAALVPGEIRLKIDQTWRIAAATNGYAEIGPELTIIVVNAAEWPEQIDVRRAEKALARAEARLKDPKVSAQDKNHARHGVSRAKARLKVANKYMQSASHQSAMK